MTAKSCWFIKKSAVFKTVSQITAFREGFSRFSKRTYKFREF